MRKRYFKVILIVVVMFVVLVAFAACKPRNENTENGNEFEKNIEQEEKEPETVPLDLKVNGYSARTEGEEIFVTVSNTQKLSLASNNTTETYKVVKYYYDRECTQEITDITNIFTQENAFTIYIKTIQNDDQIKTYRLNIDISLVDIPPEEAQPYDNRLYSIKINNSYADVTNGIIYFTVPYDTEKISIDNWAVCNSASIAFYYDEGLTQQIDDIKNIALIGNKDFYVSVAAENGNTKVYILRVTVFKSSLCNLENMVVNGCNYYESDGYLTFDLPFTEMVGIENVVISRGAQIKYFYDLNGNNEILNISSMDRSSLNKIGNNYYFYARITSDNGYYSNFIKIKLNIEKCSENQLLSIVLNGQKADIIGEDIYLGVEKSTYMKFNNVQVSDYASYKFNNINNYVYNVFNSSYLNKGKSFVGSVTITAENGDKKEYDLLVDLIPTDCMINGYTVNGVKFSSKKNYNDVTVPYAESLDIGVSSNNAETITYYWDEECLIPIDDNTNIRINEKENIIFIKAIKGTSQANYKLKVIVSQRPIIYAKQYENIQLDKWQTIINLKDYVEIQANDYINFTTNYYINNELSRDGIITISNNSQIMNITIKVNGDGFDEITAFMIMSITKYEIIPLDINVKNEYYYQRESESIKAKDLFEIKSGDYLLGEHYQLQLTNLSGTSLIFNDWKTNIKIPVGDYTAKVIGLVDDVNTVVLGTVMILDYSLIDPDINAKKSITEIRLNEAPYLVENLFAFNANDYNDSQIIYYLTTNGVNVKPITSLNEVGIYNITAVVYFGNDGTISAQTTLLITENISNNANASIYLDGELVKLENDIYLTNYHNSNVNHEIIVETESSHAIYTVFLNDIATENFISLNEGVNIVSVIVTAEDLSKKTYIFKLTRNEKIKPQILIESKIIEYQLSKDENQINLMQFFAIEKHEYNDIILTMSYNGVQLGSILNINNEDANITIYVELLGDFDTIYDSFTLNIKAYKEIAIKLKPNCYEFFAEDRLDINSFLETLEIYGYSANNLSTILLIDNKLIVGTIKLEVGEHSVSISILENNNVITKQNFIILIRNLNDATTIVNQKFNTAIIETQKAQFNLKDLFTVQYLNIFEDDTLLEIKCNGIIINNNNNIEMCAGENILDIFVRNKNTYALISYTQMNFFLDYRIPINEKIGSLKIDGKYYDINETIVVRYFIDAPTIIIELFLNDGSIIELSDIKFVYGENTIKFENYELVVYCLYYERDYITDFKYNGNGYEINIENSTLEIKMESPLDFDENAVVLELNESTAQGISYTVQQVSKSLFMVKYFYNGVEVSFRYGLISDISVLKVFDAVKNINCEGNYVICNWQSNNIYAVVDNIKPFEEYNIILGMYDGYTYKLTGPSNICAGKNIATLTIVNQQGREYSYDFILYVNSIAPINNVKYNNESLLQNDSGQYLIDITNLVDMKDDYVSFDYVEYYTSLHSNMKKSIDENGNCYKIQYNILYERTNIFSFEIVISNNNATVEVTIDDEIVNKSKNEFIAEVTYHREEMVYSPNINIYFNVEQLAIVEGIDVYKLNDKLLVYKLDTSLIPDEYSISLNFRVKAINGFYKNYKLTVNLHCIEAETIFTIKHVETEISYTEFDSTGDGKITVNKGQTSVILDIVSEKFSFDEMNTKTETFEIQYDEESQLYYIEFDIYDNSGLMAYCLSLIVTFSEV